MMRLEGLEAIEYAEENDVLLSKFGDPTEESREDLTIEEARKIVREDPRLVYIDVTSR